MKQIQTKILKNEEIKSGFFRMQIGSAYLAKTARPGQFVEVRCGKETDPLLRRPIGVNRIVRGGIELLYEVVGKGTELMSGMKKNNACDVIGPLGNGFSILRKTINDKRKTILVAGGNGVAPLLFLAEELAKNRKEIYVLIGGCSKRHILCEKDFKKTGAKVLVSTEDGSRGCKGLVTDLLKNLLRKTINDIRYTIYTCGPTGMLAAVAKIAEENRIPCQVSLEERMACGVGVCLGCPVRVKKITKNDERKTMNEYKMVCKDGPVFNAEELVW